MMHRKTTRRKFLTTSLTTGMSLVGCKALQHPGEGAPPVHENPTLPEPTSTDARPNRNDVSALTTTIPQAELGRTGVSLPILGLGGAGRTPLSRPNQDQAALEQIQRAWELGIRYFDTAASYGPSESLLGQVLPAYRDDVFLASKTAARDRDGAWRELERSLQRLNTDYLDLWQFHHVSFEQELDTLFGDRGAVKTLQEAQDQGLVRFSGITGHHEPAIIAEGLRRYPFDHTLIPINAADPHHPRPFIPTVLPIAREQNVGVSAMKVPAYGRLLKPGVLDGMHQAFGYAMSQPGVQCAVIAAETLDQLEENVRVASGFQLLDPTALAEIERRTAAAWQDNTFFRAWT